MAESLLVAAVPWGAAARLLVTGAATMGSPGPATVSLAAAGSAYGVRRSAGFFAGILGGTMLVLVAVVTGVTAALLAVPGVRPVLLGVSAAYILWLAYHVATAPPLAARSDTGAPSIRGALLLAVANPKAWIAIAATVASAQLAHDATVDAAAKTAILAPLLIVSMSVWLTVGASLAPVLRDPRRARIVNVVLAATLVAATALAVLH